MQGERSRRLGPRSDSPLPACAPRLVHRRPGRGCGRGRRRCAAGHTHSRQVTHAQGVSVPENLGPLGWAEAGAGGRAPRSVRSLLARRPLGSSPGGRSAPGSAHFRGGRPWSPSPPPTPAQPPAPTPVYLGRSIAGGARGVEWPGGHRGPARVPRELKACAPSTLFLFVKTPRARQVGLGLGTRSGSGKGRSSHPRRPRRSPRPLLSRGSGGDARPGASRRPRWRRWPPRAPAGPAPTRPRPSSCGSFSAPGAQVRAAGRGYCGGRAPRKRDGHGSPRPARWEDEGGRWEGAEPRDPQTCRFGEVSVCPSEGIPSSVSRSAAPAWLGDSRK